MNLVLEGGKTYFRFSNDYAEFVKDILIEQNEYNDVMLDVALTSSGIQAISITMQVLFSKFNWTDDICVVYGSEMYNETPKTIDYYCDFYKNKYNKYKVDINDNEAIMNLFKKKLYNKKVIFVFEACTNPNGYLFDFSLIPLIKHICKNIFIVADTTWTPEFNVLKLGVDLLAISLTKHHSGSKCIIGGIIGKKEDKIIDDINNLIKISGLHVSPYNCSILLDNIINMTERIDNSSKEALKLARELCKKEKVKQINYPLLEDNYSYKLAKKYKIRSTILNTLLEIDDEYIEEWVETRNNIYFSTSYGSSETRIDPWYKKGDIANHYWIRIAVGYDSKSEDIINALDI